MRIAGAAYTLSPMRIAFFGGRPFYAHSRGVEGVALEGAIPSWYRPPTFESSFPFLPVARPTDSRLLTRPRRSEGRRILGCLLFSAPGGWDKPASELRLRFQSGRVAGEGRPGSRSIWPPATRPASRWAHSDEPCSSPRLDEVRDFNRRRAQHIIRRRSQLRKHLTELAIKAARESPDKRKARLARPTLQPLSMSNAAPIPTSLTPFEIRFLTNFPQEDARSDPPP